MAVSRQQRKPIVCNLMTDKGQWTETVKILKEGGVPCFALPGEAARAVTALVRYHWMQNREVGSVMDFDDVDKATAQGIITKAAAAGRQNLSAQEVYDILDAYRIPTAQWRMADSADAAEKPRRPKSVSRWWSRPMPHPWSTKATWAVWR